VVSLVIPRLGDNKAQIPNDDDMLLEAERTPWRILPIPYIPNDFLKREKTSPFEGLTSP
jgi:hypothetical protein